MNLRSNVETSIRGSAPTAGLHLKISVENGVAIPEGLVHDLNQADDVARLASKVKGITAVDRSRMQLDNPGPGNEEVAVRVGMRLYELPKYASRTIAISVESGVVTLTGTFKNAAWRGEIRQVCGAVEGVIDVVDRIESPDTPDDKIQKALNAVFGPRVVPRFPGRVTAVAKDGVVSLEGRVPRLYDKLTAVDQARGINGVRRVDDTLELGSGTAIKVVDP